MAWVQSSECWVSQDVMPWISQAFRVTEEK
jgi:hypothetical protein